MPITTTIDPPLPGDAPEVFDAKAFAAWAKEQTKAFGGKDVTVGDGVVEFTTEKGANGMFTQFDTKCLFLLFGGENPAMNNLIKSIGLTD